MTPLPKRRASGGRKRMRRRDKSFQLESIQTLDSYESIIGARLPHHLPPQEGKRKYVRRLTKKS